jgi:hypothetical protein
MCKFFSLISDGEGNCKYFDYTIRKQILSGELYQNDNLDSHTTIAHHFGIEPVFEELWNRWEYNPLTQTLELDQKGKGAKNDRDSVLEFCRNLDFTTVVPELIIKPIINPLKLGTAEVTEADIELLNQWDSVWTSVWTSARDSVWDSVGDSVGDSVWDSVWDSVGDLVWDSIGDSVGDSIGAYYATFFAIDYKIDLSSAQKLWERGIVPSFDGKVWRLHGADGKIIYTQPLT